MTKDNYTLGEFLSNYPINMRCEEFNKIMTEYKNNKEIEWILENETFDLDFFDENNYNSNTNCKGANRFEKSIELSVFAFPFHLLIGAFFCALFAEASHNNIVFVIITITSFVILAKSYYDDDLIMNDEN